MFDIKVYYLKFNVMQSEYIFKKRIGLDVFFRQKTLCIVVKTKLELKDFCSGCSFDECCMNISKSFNFFSTVFNLIIIIHIRIILRIK